jgi:Flp pilus assembly CpaF family ATPase
MSEKLTLTRRYLKLTSRPDPTEFWPTTGLGTIHANGALLGLTRLESLVAEGTDAPQQKLIAETVDLVIFVDQEPSLKAGRKVREMLLVTGWKEGQYQVEQV